MLSTPYSMYLVLMYILVFTCVQGRPAREQVLQSDLDCIHNDCVQAGDVADTIRYLADLDRVYSEHIRPR